MEEVRSGLWVGRECEWEECRWVVHACKNPCHRDALGYVGSLDSGHEHYLSYRRGCSLYLNMIDPKVPLFQVSMFQEFLRFANECWPGGEGLLIHCNQGLSRSPSLALLFMVRLGELSNKSYDAARSEFEVLYPRYSPGRGIEIFLSSHWGELSLLIIT